MRKWLWMLLLAVCWACPARAETWLVRQDGTADFTTLTAAVQAAAAGDTVCLAPGVYDGAAETFPIVVDKPITLRGEAGAVLDSPRFQTLLRVEADGVAISGIRFQVRKWGVVAARAQGLILEDCAFILADEACRTSSTAVWLEGMKRCTLRRCAFEGVGVCVAGDPLGEESAGKAVLTGLCEVGEDLEYFTTHTVEACTVNGKPLYYLVGEKDAVVPRDAGGLIAACCEGLTVRGLDVSDSSMGIEIVHSRDVLVENVTADRCGIFGTYVAFVEDGTLRNVRVQGTNHGIDTRACARVTVENCLAEDCDQGIFWSHSTDCVTRNCTVRRCGFGYFASAGDGNRIQRCVFEANADGIYLQNEPQTAIEGCQITQSSVVGLRVLKSSCTCEDTAIISGWTGVILYEASDTTLRACTLDGNASANVYLAYGRRLEIADCTFRGETKAHLEAEGTQEDVFVRRCAFTGSQAEMISAKSHDLPRFEDNTWAEPGVFWTGEEWNGSTEGAYPYRNCDIVQLNREPARADSVPYDTPEQARLGAVAYQKELSGRSLLLSQTSWRFRLYDAPAACQQGDGADFFQAGFDDSGWDAIFVPSVWQTQGYDHPIYTNTTQKFARNFGNKVGYPAELPLAPTTYNPVGLYRYGFTVPESWRGERIHLVFEGVDAAFYLWINGKQVGYAEDSFTTDAFDITDYVVFGEENTLAVKVYRWCDGSWLEDQDYFDLSGIFRDVYLYAAPQAGVRDFSLVTDFDSTLTDGSLSVSLSVENRGAEAAAVTVRAALYDAEGLPVAWTPTEAACVLEAGASATAELAGWVAAPRKWSAEDPYLYTLVLEETAGGQTVYESCQVGFRKITYKANESGWFEGTTQDADLIRINGQPISLRGVNRHETHPAYGYALPRAVMEEDVRIMKENNINAVRTSHYPNSPYWYYLCDKYGIYVMDEANLEVHSNMIYENERITAYMADAIVDREYSMVCRDRNHACVVMWSLGNECKNPEILRTILVAPYADQTGERRILHAYDPTRPWHYEQAGAMYETGIDVYSGMYETVEQMIAHGQADGPAPYIQCEYEHAMGNALGNMDEYMAAFDTYRNLQGGFIWDFIDQAIAQTAEDGTVYFGYGGDFGERVHDDNFCANGLLLPDRTLQPEMAEVRYQYQQIKFEAVDADAGQILVKNYFLFTDIGDKYECRWTLTRDDTVVDSGVMDEEAWAAPNVDALTNQPGTRLMTVPFTLADDAGAPGSEYFLNLSVRLRAADGLLAAGHEVAKEQFALTVRGGGKAAAAQSEAIRVTREGDELVCEGEGFVAALNLSTGRLTRYEARDGAGRMRALIVPGEGPMGSFYRAATDNDRAFGSGLGHMNEPWKTPGEWVITGTEVDEAADWVRVSVRGAYPALNGTAMDMAYTIRGDGSIRVTVDIAPAYSEELRYIPVAGTQMTVPGEYECLAWFGRGPEENYADRQTGTKVGRWQTTVTDNFFPYMEPSETGNRTGVRWVSLTDGEGFGLLAAADGQPMEMSALHYTAEELNRVKHPYELRAMEDTVLRLNAAQIGLGGDNSWYRIIPHEAYLTNESRYAYAYVLSPLRPGEDAMARCRALQAAE